jgi:2-amino-4-hydroxy-6-hydroxymethyldihydropteridine diphosphokinase
MVIAYIGLGSNLGNRRGNLLQAWSRLGEIRGVELLVLSAPYRTEPVGMESTNWFINAVGSLKTSLEPEELLTAMLAIEAGLGRKIGLKSMPEDRSVDLDLLYWGDRVCDDPRVILPHPEVANRLFVLFPLADIGPEVRHPVSQKTSLEMLTECKAKQPEKILDSVAKKTSWPNETNEVSR